MGSVRIQPQHVLSSDWKPYWCLSFWRPEQSTKNWRTATISNWSLYGWQRPERPSTPVISHYCLDFLYSTPINAFSKPSPRGRIERAVHSFNTCPSTAHFAKFYEYHYDCRLRTTSRKAATVCLKSNIKGKVSPSTPLRRMGSADVQLHSVTAPDGGQWSST